MVVVADGVVAIAVGHRRRSNRRRIRRGCVTVNVAVVVLFVIATIPAIAVVLAIIVVVIDWSLFFGGVMIAGSRKCNRDPRRTVFVATLMVAVVCGMG